MTKRGLMAAAAISVLVFAFPACQSTVKPEMPHPTDTSAVAPSNYDSAVAPSKGKGFKDPLIKHTQAQMDCTKARADQQCVDAANQCFYKFTVNEVVDQQNLKVTYPPTVWKETVWEEIKKEEIKESERNPQAEEEYKNKIGKSPFSITTLNPTDKRMKDKTYVFTRCPKNEFTLGSEIDPQTGMPVGLQQSAR